MNTKLLVRVLFSVLASASFAFGIPTSTSGSATNFSVRADVSVKPLIGGLVVDGTRVLLVRAVGPGLAKLGVSDVMSEPQITMFDDKGQRIYGGLPMSQLGDREFALIVAAVRESGAFDIDRESLDCVLLVPWSGAATFHVRGVGASVGEVLLECYVTPATSFDPDTFVGTNAWTN